MPTETTGPEGQPHDVMPAEVDVTRCPDCGHPGSYDARVLVAGRGLYRCRNSHCWQDAREQPSSKGVVVVGPEPGPSMVGEAVEHAQPGMWTTITPWAATREDLVDHFEQALTEAEATAPLTARRAAEVAAAAWERLAEHQRDVEEDL